MMVYDVGCAAITGIMFCYTPLFMCFVTGMVCGIGFAKLYYYTIRLSLSLCSNDSLFIEGPW